MKKTLLLLTAGLVILGAILLMREGARARALAPGHAFNVGDTAKVDRLEVAMRAGQVTLIRHQGLWRVFPDSFPADPGRVRMALRHLLGLQDKEVVSRSTDTTRLAEFGLYGDDLKRITWTAAGRTVSIHLGHTSGIDFNSTYWKHPEGDEVYRTPGNFTHEIGINARDWKDRTLFPPFGGEDVRSVGVHWQNRLDTTTAYHVTVNDEGVYRLTLAEAPDTTRLPEANGQALFAAAAQLTVDEIPDAKAVETLAAPGERPAVVVTITLRDGTVHELAAGSPLGEHVYLRHPVHRGVVGVSASRLEMFPKDPSTLLTPRPVPPSPEDWEAIDPHTWN